MTDDQRSIIYALKELGWDLNKPATDEEIKIAKEFDESFKKNMWKLLA